MSSPHRSLVAALQAEFVAQRAAAEKAIAQLGDDDLRRSAGGDTNSVAVIMKHLAGNLRSRFTDFLTSDGEKPWRDRDSEFLDDFAPGAAGRQQATARWNEGWACALAALDALTDADLARTVTIRGEPHTVQRALARSLAHAGYHTGQILLIARLLVGPERWRVITIPKGGSQEHNRRMGYTT